MISKELVAASATPIVLSLLSRTENYGYAIIQHVRDLSDGQMRWTDGMLYPVLHRLERKGLIRSRWEAANTGRRRKYYSITKKGSAALENSQGQWRVVNSTLDKLWNNHP
jgi:DNA-binding PadR family transcriptional regulator